MASTAASTRKNASAFEQTWDETDAAFLDPTSLPIQRLPRAWERKQEVKKVGNGKKKEIWRRHATRSRTADATANQDPESDARARPVKRQQRLSPKAIEKSATSRFGKTRAFKATRWDRRKSVLPRKKATAANTAYDPTQSLEDADEEGQDTTITDIGNDSFLEIDVQSAGLGLQETPLLPEGENRRATFTFALEEDADAPTQRATNDISSALVDEISTSTEQIDEDATIARLFRSPTEAATETVEALSYPKLPSLSEFESEAALEISNTEPNTSAEEVSSTERVTPLDNARSSLASHQDLYPSLPEESHPEEQMDCMNDASTSEDAAVSSLQEAQDESENIELDDVPSSPDEDFTEASLQLNLQREMETEDPDASADDEELADGTTTQNAAEASTQQEPSTTQDMVDDITSGLTLGPVVNSSREPTPRKLRSPSPPPRMESGPEDTTMTFAFDDDTALLKNFLSRAAASKANKADNIARRESLQNRRDSDVVRHALASPRKVLEDKDPNSPSKYDNDVTLDLSQTLTLSMEPSAPLSPSKVVAENEEGNVDDSKSGRTSRRSSRAKKSRLPAPSLIPTDPPKISVKRDGGDPVILKKTDAQELSLLTRTNTRKNKQGAVNVNVRLLKISNEARTAEEAAPDTADTTDTAKSVVQVPGKKYVRWDSQLTYFQEDTEAIANALADAESLATPDELSSAPPSAMPMKLKAPKVPRDTTATPKVRKIRNLGSTNGTPGKCLLTPASLLPDVVLDDKDEPRERQRERSLKPKSSRLRKGPLAGTDTISAPAPVELPLPVLEISPVGIDPTKAATATKERKSRLATPKKVKLPQLSSSALGDGKENQKTGIASPPKRGIRMPSVGVPSSSSLEIASGATGLPRRRGRKV